MLILIIGVYYWLCMDLTKDMVNYIVSDTVMSILRSKLYTYDDVVERVAQQLGLDDPSKIRLTSHNCYSQQPKPQPIKYRGVDHLSDMLIHYNQVISCCLIYYVIGGVGEAKLI